MSQRQAGILPHLYQIVQTDMVTPLLTLQSGWTPRPDQSTRSTLQLFLERLDKHIETVIRIHREMVEFRARIAELLTNCEPEVTAGDRGEWEPQDSTVDLQAVINDEQLTFVNGKLNHDRPNCQLCLTFPPSLQSHRHSMVDFRT